MTIIRHELKTYNRLNDFLLEGDNWNRFKEIFGFTPTRNYIKRKLKTMKNFTTDVEIIEKMLEPLEDSYVVGEWYTSWENTEYAMESCSLLWVHRLLEM